MRKLTLLATFLMALAIRSHEDEVLNNGEEESSRKIVCLDATREDAIEIADANVQDPGGTARKKKSCAWLLQDQERKVKYCLKEEVKSVCPLACDSCLVENESSTLKLISDSTSVTRETYDVICPEPHNNYQCPSDYEPVSCGQSYCVYDNMCKAQQTSFKYSECGSLAAPTPALSSCPSPQYGCYTPFDPVWCGPNDCWYSSLCYAQQAGFTSIQCKHATTPHPTPYPTPHPTPAHDVCPVPDMHNNCDHIRHDVYCGPRNCWYLNICWAQHASFSAHECGINYPTPTPPPHPTPNPTAECPVTQLPGLCDQDHEPVVCGHDHCRYLNICHAGLANFDSHVCTKVPQPPHCPHPQINGDCPQIYNPVICGADCEYLNLCFAKKAFFDPNHCRAAPPDGPVHTPAPTPSPDKCGDTDFTFKIDQVEDTYPHYHKRKQCDWLKLQRRWDKYCHRIYVQHACPFTCCVCKKNRPFCKQTAAPTASPTSNGKGKGSRKIRI